ncbi:High affinity nitrate transporter 2.5 [Phytophthora ramorum]|uniref:High affinity nitrate transporter 2.5 n=1 Tax=Phytophthora ramorum TaxID=164328 RepID=UPI0030B1AE1B|nr:High affinity nitrate transporter 2.5 [Phytophthora ramorum]
MIAEIPRPPLDLGTTSMPRAAGHKSNSYQGMPTDPYHQIPVLQSNRPRQFSFDICTDPHQGDKATEIRLLSFARPHMRAFHYSWLSFFIAFFGWFSIPPIMPTIKKQLNLTEDQVSNSNIVSLASTIIGRLVVGPLCDRYGARSVQAVLLVVGAVPVASAALVTSYTGLMFARFFIGLVGCTFVATAYWTSTMFSHEVVGSANAISCGWGNLGAGVAYLVTPLVFDLITINATISDNYGWRMALLLPAMLMIAIGICTYLFSDDCPQGNYVDLKRNHVMADRAKSELYYGFLAVAKQPVVWVLAFQYACCFGVELQVHNVLSLYYYEDFKIAGCDAASGANQCRLLSQTKASAISSCFGLMCIFARAVGGYASDVANRHYDMKGRITTQLLCLAFQAVFLYLFSQLRVLAWSIPCLVVFGFFAQASTGTTYGIVPYVCPEFTGVTSGIVGAGGNMGGLAWGFLFKGVASRSKSFEYLSFFVASSAASAMFIKIHGTLQATFADETVELAFSDADLQDLAIETYALRPCYLRGAAGIMPAEMRALHNAAYDYFNGVGQAARGSSATVLRKLTMNMADESQVVPVSMSTEPV